MAVDDDQGSGSDPRSDPIPSNASVQDTFFTTRLEGGRWVITCRFCSSDHPTVYTNSQRTYAKGRLKIHLDKEHHLDLETGTGWAEAKSKLESAEKTDSVRSISSSLPPQQTSVPVLFASQRAEAEAKKRSIAEWRKGGVKFEKSVDVWAAATAANRLSFNSLTSPEIRGVISTYREEAAFPTQYQVKKRVTTRAGEANNRIMADLKKAIGVSLLFDATELNGHKRVAVFATYTMEGRSTVQKAPIALITPTKSGAYTAERIVEDIKGAMTQYGIRHFDGVTVDGGPDARKTARILANKIAEPEAGEADSDDEEEDLALLFEGAVDSLVSVTVSCGDHKIALAARWGVDACNAMLRAQWKPPAGVEVPEEAQGDEPQPPPKKKRRTGDQEDPDGLERAKGKGKGKGKAAEPDVAVADNPATKNKVRSKNPLVLMGGIAHTGGRSRVGAVDSLLAPMLGAGTTHKKAYNEVVDKHYQTLGPLDEGSASRRRPVGPVRRSSTRWWGDVAFLRSLIENWPFFEHFYGNGGHMEGTYQAEIYQWLKHSGLYDELVSLYEELTQLLALLETLEGDKQPTLPRFLSTVVGVWRLLSPAPAGATNLARRPGFAPDHLVSEFRKGALDRFMQTTSRTDDGVINTLITAVTSSDKAAKITEFPEATLTTSSSASWASQIETSAAAMVLASLLSPDFNARSLAILAIGADSLKWTSSTVPPPSGISGVPDDFNKVMMFIESALVRLDVAVGERGPLMETRRPDQPSRQRGSATSTSTTTTTTTTTSNLDFIQNLPMPGSSEREDPAPRPSGTTLRDELLAWMNSPHANATTFLDYWGSRLTMMPRLSKLAFKLASILATQATAERCFSIMKAIWTPARNRLEADLLKDMLDVRYANDREEPRSRKYDLDVFYE